MGRLARRSGILLLLLVGCSTAHYKTGWDLDIRKSYPPRTEPAKRLKHEQHEIGNFVRIGVVSYTQEQSSSFDPEEYIAEIARRASAEWGADSYYVLPYFTKTGRVTSGGIKIVGRGTLDNPETDIKGTTGFVKLDCVDVVLWRYDPEVEVRARKKAEERQRWEAIDSRRRAADEALSRDSVTEDPERIGALMTGILAGGESAALLVVVHRASPAVVRELLGRGADPNHQEGAIVLQAAKRGDAEVLRILLQAGAKPDLPGDDPSRRPLFITLQAGNLAAARVLAEHGARVDGAAGVAARAGDRDLFDLLVKDPKDLADPEVLHAAATSGSAALVERLLKAEPDEKKRALAATRTLSTVGSAEVLRSLMDAGGDLELQDEHGQWALESTIRPLRTSAEVQASIRLLLAAGARINAQARTDGRTILIRAVQTGMIDVVRLLLDAGADPNLVRKADKWTREGTALDYARDEKMRILLRTKGGKPLSELGR